MLESAAIRLLVLRHAPTPWNAEGRIQGRSDISLSPEGKSLAKNWQLPSEALAWDVYASPLRRTRETAQLLGLENCRCEPLLIEMDWGLWEGKSLRNLRAELGKEMTEMEARGLDFQPPGGESPRMVQKRVGPFLQDLAKSGRSAVLVTHKGVLRALYSLARGWDMKEKPPEKLRDSHAQLFALTNPDTPALQVLRLNVPLLREEADNG